MNVKHSSWLVVVATLGIGLGFVLSCAKGPTAPYKEPEKLASSHPDQSVRTGAPSAAKQNPSSVEPEPPLQPVDPPAPMEKSPTAAGPSADSVQDLIKKLEDPEAPARRIAAVQLGLKGKLARKALPILEKLAKEDLDPEVKKAASSAVRKIPPPVPEPVARLIEGLDSKGIAGRYQAAQESWGPAQDLARILARLRTCAKNDQELQAEVDLAKGLIDKLTELAKNDPDEDVRRASEKALWKFRLHQFAGKWKVEIEGQNTEIWWIMTDKDDRLGISRKGAQDNWVAFGKGLGFHHEGSLS